MKIIALVGSLRRESYNLKVARFMKERYEGKLDIEIVTLNDIPLFNEDIEKDPPESVKEFKRKVRETEGVLIVTPEYNYSIPGVLKNALDWCSRVERVMLDKPVFIMGASNGNVGTARCQGDLLRVLNAPGMAAIVLPGNHVVMPNIQDDFNETGEFTNERTKKYLDKVVDNYIEWAQRIKK